MLLRQRSARLSMRRIWKTTIGDRWFIDYLWWYLLSNLVCYLIGLMMMIFRRRELSRRKKRSLRSLCQRWMMRMMMKKAVARFVFGMFWFLVWIVIIVMWFFLNLFVDLLFLVLCRRMMMNRSWRKKLA